MDDEELKRRIEARARELWEADGRPEGRFTSVNVALDVLHHHDRIVHHQAHREHDREQRQQVDRESRHEHQEDGADE